MLVRDGALGVALAIGLYVSEIANVTLLVFGSAVGLGIGVDCGCGINIRAFSG